MGLRTGTSHLHSLHHSSQTESPASGPSPSAHRSRSRSRSAAQPSPTTALTIHRNKQIRIASPPLVHPLAHPPAARHHSNSKQAARCRLIAVCRRLGSPSAEPPPGPLPPCAPPPSGVPSAGWRCSFSCVGAAPQQQVVHSHTPAMASLVSHTHSQPLHRAHYLLPQPHDARACLHLPELAPTFAHLALLCRCV